MRETLRGGNALGFSKDFPHFVGGFYNYVPPSLGNRTWLSYRIPG